MKIKASEGSHAFFIGSYKLRGGAKTAVIIENESFDTRILITVLGDAYIADDLTVTVKDGASKIIAVSGSVKECISLMDSAVSKYAFSGDLISYTDKYYRNMLSHCDQRYIDKALSLLSLRRGDGLFITSPFDRVFKTENAPYLMSALLSLGLYGCAKDLADFFASSFEKCGQIYPMYEEGKAHPSHDPYPSLAAALRCVLVYTASSACADRSKYGRFIKSALKKCIKGAECGSLSFSGYEDIFTKGILSLEHLFYSSFQSTLDLLVSIKLYGDIFGEKALCEFNDAYEYILHTFKENFLQGPLISLSSPKGARSRRPRTAYSACSGCLDRGFTNYRELEISKSGKYLCPLCLSRITNDTECFDVCEKDVSAAALGYLILSDFSHLAPEKSIKTLSTYKGGNRLISCLAEASLRKIGLLTQRSEKGYKAELLSEDLLSLSLFIISKTDNK